MPYSRITRTAYGADAIRYARGHGRGHDGSEKRSLYSAGVNMLPDRALSFERQMKPLWDRMDPRHKIQVDRCVVSFSPKELNPDSKRDQLKALEIGCRIAEANAPNCQSAVFVQADGRGHKLHLHILTNDVRMGDHKGLEREAYYHPHFRKIVDKICKEYFDLDEPGKAPERTTQAVRGRRMKNEAIRERNKAEAEAAEREGRIPLLMPEKYIWQDDLKARIQRAAAKAWDEESFAQALRMDGVDLLKQKQKDGSETYVHHATKTMPEYYVYELFDTGGFWLDRKIPANLKSRSCKMGTNYSPESVTAMFRGKRPEVEKKSIDIKSIVASAKKPEKKPARPAEPEKLTPTEKNRLEMERAVALAKQHVSPLVKAAYPDTDAEWEEKLYNQFVTWRNGLRKRMQAKGQELQPIYSRNEKGEGGIVAKNLDQQYKAFLAKWQESEAAAELERIQRDRLALAADIIRTAEEIKWKQEEQDGREHGDD